MTRRTAACSLDGRDARDCSLSWLREQIAVVLQDTVLFSGTVRENIAYGTEATDTGVVEAAQAAAAHEFIRSLPDGYDTELGPAGRPACPADNGSGSGSPARCCAIRP